MLNLNVPISTTADAVLPVVDDARLEAETKRRRDIRGRASIAQHAYNALNSEKGTLEVRINGPFDEFSSGMVTIDENDLRMGGPIIPLIHELLNGWIAAGHELDRSIAEANQPAPVNGEACTPTEPTSDETVPISRHVLSTWLMGIAAKPTLLPSEAQLVDAIRGHRDDPRVGDIIEWSNSPDPDSRYAVTDIDGDMAVLNGVMGAALENLTVIHRPRPAGQRRIVR